MLGHWIAVDWGTSNLRASVVTDAGDVIAELSSPKGMAALSPDDFEPALLALIEPYLVDGLVCEVVACGMVGAKQGWVEAAYASVPCGVPVLSGATLAPVKDTRIKVSVLPGVSQSKPADVMRGEETQIGGFLAGDPNFDGVICQPGTHSKWAHISAQEIVSFRTFMTGELYALLAKQSVLRHTVDSDGWDAKVFLNAVDDAMSNPAVLAGSLFSLRATDLVQGITGGAANARLSGLLIGAELAGAKPYWLGQRVVILGAERVAQAYETALLAQGVDVRVLDGTEMTRAGLIAAKGG